MSMSRKDYDALAAVLASQADTSTERMGKRDAIRQEAAARRLVTMPRTF